MSESFLHQPFTQLPEPSPRSAWDTDQHQDSRTDLDGVMRQWLSSIRRNYRRTVNGRSTLNDAPAAPARARHRAPTALPGRILKAQVGRPDGRVGGTPRKGNDSAEERPGSAEQGGG